MFGRKKGYDTGLRVKIFKSPRPLQIMFEVFDLQGDGEIMFVFGLLYWSIRFMCDFNAYKYRWRCDYRLFDRDGNIFGKAGCMKYNSGECGTLSDDIKTFFKGKRCAK
jgi:hypothetical protein